MGARFGLLLTLTLTLTLAATATLPVALPGAAAPAREGEERPMIADNSIHYVELRATDMAATKRFYTEAFGWGWTDYGPDYAAITGAGLDGGVRLDPDSSAPSARPDILPALVILYARDLEAAEARVRAAGGEIVRPIFAFPGGRRFHFLDPAGNELAVWSDAGAE